MTKEDYHKFNDEFITRYKTQLSQGKDMRCLWSLESWFYEKEAAFFHLFEEYKSTDGKHKMVMLSRDECYVYVKIDDEGFNLEIGPDIRFIDKVEHLFKDGIEFIAV